MPTGICTLNTANCKNLRQSCASTAFIVYHHRLEHGATNMHSIVLDCERRLDSSGGSRSQCCVLEDLSSSSRCSKDKELCPWPCLWSQVFGLGFGLEV